MHTAAVTASQNQASITMGWTSRSPADSLSFYGKAATYYTLIAVALKPQQAPGCHTTKPQSGQHHNDG